MGVSYSCDGRRYVRLQIRPYLIIKLTSAFSSVFHVVPSVTPEEGMRFLPHSTEVGQHLSRLFCLYIPCAKHHPIDVQNIIPTDKNNCQPYPPERKRRDSRYHLGGVTDDDANPAVLEWIGPVFGDSRIGRAVHCVGLLGG